MTRLVTLLACSFYLVVCRAQPSDSIYLHELKQAASAQQLAKADAWLALLHYSENTVFAADTSEADDEAFFFAKNGKEDPEAELLSTLEAFFAPPSGNAHPQCNFPARYYWLTRVLKFDGRRLHEMPCPAFAEWRTNFNATSVTLVFPASYLNSPSSMFGHTFLRLDQATKKEGQSLLAYTINYAADANERDNEFAYAFKGILGGYPGIIAVQPYYEKVREYGDWENRDIWEYQLNLTVNEIDQLIRHTWELLSSRFDYFFLDENCSYRLLRLLEVARPSLALTPHFRFRAIPTDTVRAIAEERLVTRAVYRPSASTKLRHHIRQLTSEQRGVALQLANPKIRTENIEELLGRLDLEDRAAALEVAYEYLHFERMDEKGLPFQLVAERLHRLLLERSKIPYRSDFKPISQPEIRDDQGHKTSRIFAGYGWREDRSFTSLQFRSAYHDLTDPLAGYQDGAAIKFMDGSIRLYESGSLQLENITVLEITSLTPRDQFFKPLSWTVGLGARRKLFENDRSVTGYFDAGGGFTYQLGTTNVFGLGVAQLEVGDSFENSYAFGPGVQLGWIYEGLAGQGRISLKATRFLLGDRHTAVGFGYDHTINLVKNHAINLNFRHDRVDSNKASEVIIGYQYYF